MESVLLKGIRMLDENVILQSCVKRGREKWEKMQRPQSASKNQPCSNYRVDPAQANIMVHEERWIQEKPVQGKIEWYQ